ncbi:Nose resistant to fluoxetine protein 6 [Halotydeus destructor]|nr:Nose resistant to fluoxetine protein 6 [Halotydeus destructor]
MFISRHHSLLIAVAIVCCLPIITSTIRWPRAVDDFDEQLISYARFRRQADNEEVDEETTTTVTTTSTTSVPMVDEKMAANKTVKNHTIDWDKVEENWRKVLTEDEVKVKWDKMEESTKNGIRSLLRSIFPQIVSMSSDAKVSGNCSAGILKWIISLRHVKGWAIKMLDAIGKPPSGILEGSITMFGNHQQCLGIRAPDDEDDFDEDEDAGPPKFKEFFRGQYCVLELKPWLPKKPHFYGFTERIASLQRKEGDDSVFSELSELAIFLHFVSFRLDLCLPSICSREDIQRVANFLASLLDFRARVTRCEIQSDNFVAVSTTQAITLVMFIGFIFLVITATAASIALPLLRKRKSVPSIINSLCLGNSWNEICGLDMYQKKPKLGSLYGLRFQIIFWIILVHTCTMINYQFFREMQTIKDFALKRFAQILTNSSLQYSCLIFLSAFSLGYYNEGKGFWKAFKTIFRKYFRIVPVVMVGVAIMILLPLLDTGLLKGPVWKDIIDNRTLTCQQTWYRNIFFIQNFWHPAQSCLSETWLLCVEMQLGALFTIVLGVMASLKNRGSEVVAWTLMGAIGIIGFAFNAAEVYAYQLPPTWFWTLPDPEQRDEYFELHLFRPWTHLSTYAIGVTAGMLCAQRKAGSAGGPYGKTVTRFIGWGIVFVVMHFIILYPNDWALGKLPDETVSAVYDGAHRIVWSSLFAWAVFMIVADVQDGEPSTTNSILGNKVMVAFGRLSLNAYVCHPIVQLLILGTQQVHLFSGLTMLPYVVIGNVAMTYLLAFFISMFFEMPITAIFNARDSTITKVRELPKFNKPSTFAISSGRNGDMEMTKSDKDASKL